jgi:23S rRNA (guanosine2251-2'-O)-methyltransferase
VLEAVRAGDAHAVLVAAGRKPSPILHEIRQEALRHSVSLREVPAEEVVRLAPGQNTQGVVAQITTRSVDSISALLESRRTSGAAAFLLALDEVQDPQNVGSLIRTAEAAGVDGVILPERRTSPITGTVAKASAGAVSRVPVIRVSNLARALNEAREEGIWVVGLDASAEQAVYSADLRLPVLLVVGNESQGLRRLTREHSDVLVHLPMAGAIESLNAAVAGAVAMFEVVRQRGVPR